MYFHSIINIEEHYIIAMGNYNYETRKLTKEQK